MSSYQDLNVPFSIPIPGGLSLGKMVVVQGKVPSMSQRFAVNLLTRSGDIALHVSPKFMENKVVRNNVLNMNWGPEESHGPMPIHPGQSFEILILCENYSFKVAFNGTHFCEFSHRLPFMTISNLAVDGEVIVHNVNFKDSPGYGGSSNGYGNATPYGFRTDQNLNYNSGGYYPSVPSPRRSQSPSAPHYPGSGGGGFSQNSSLYPTQPGYPNRSPSHGLYPDLPNSNSGSVSPTPHSKPGFLDQAGAALAALGPTLIAGGTNRNAGYGKPNLLDEAGRALAGVIGGTGPAGGGQTHKGTQPRDHSGFLDNAGPALAGLLASGALAGVVNSLKGSNPPSSTRQTHSGSILDYAGSALSGILQPGGLAGDSRSSGGRMPSSTTNQPGSILDKAGLVLGEILAGGGSAGADRSLGGSTRPTQPGAFLDQAGSALAGIFGGGGGGLDSGRHKHKKLGVLGGALGTAVAGAALTGHLNPIKATKKQLKAQKKALKYGLPIAGAGLGAYALHKGLKKGFRRGSSSSSSSSSD